MQGRLDRWGDWQVTADGGLSGVSCWNNLVTACRKQEAGLLASSLRGDTQNETEFTSYFYNIATQHKLLECQRK